MTCGAIGDDLAQLSRSPPVEAVHFAPHRAVYELSMADSTAGSGVSGVTGPNGLRTQRISACDGYTQNMRFVTIMTNQEGTETVSDLRNSSWEEADGKKLTIFFDAISER